MSDDPRRWERTLVARITAGDDSALSLAFDQYSALVHGIARRIVGDQRAADVTQDVFVTLWQHPERFDPGRGSLRTFLATIARRRAIDHLRKSSRREANETRAITLDPPPTPNLEEAALAMIASERVRAAVAHLPVDQRRAIELAYFEGLTFHEVAVRTGVPEGTAKSRLRLGLARLAAALRPDGAVEWA